MRHTSVVVGVAFLCLSIVSTGSASRKEELERAAELAVERAAERVAEKAVEKALESGNSSTATETIRVSHSSVRKYDSTQKLPGLVYTPEERREQERITKEREAAELAVAKIKKGKFFKREAAYHEGHHGGNPRAYNHYPMTRHQPFKPSPQIPAYEPEPVAKPREDSHHAPSVYVYRAPSHEPMSHYHHQPQEEPNVQHEAYDAKHYPATYFHRLPKAEEESHPAPEHQEKEEVYPVTVKEIKQIYRPVFYHQPEAKSTEGHGHSDSQKDSKNHGEEISHHAIPVAPQPIRFFEVHQKAFPVLYFYHRPPVAYHARVQYIVSGLDTAKAHEEPSSHEH